MYEFCVNIPTVGFYTFKEKKARQLYGTVATVFLK